MPIHAAAPAAVLIRIALAIAPGALPPTTLAAAVDEAAAIWAPYGVVVDADGHCEVGADRTRVVEVDVLAGAERSLPPLGRPPLGAIQFDEAGAPMPAIRIFLADIVRLAAASHILGAYQSGWPATLRERATGRAIGRVIAHELGHYLLGTPQHTAEGLMRAVHSADDFVSPIRVGFGLSREAAASVAARRGGG